MIPNQSQKKAIEAQINTDLRVLAGPGSGKTYVIEHRFAYLVSQGINPNQILVCTFSKNMADEMGKRIQRTCPRANLEYISTIHAFCYRVLCKWYVDSRWYNWKVPKDWEIKKAIEEIISLVWRVGERPSASETFDYICLSKHHGLTTDDSYQFYIDLLGQEQGAWLYEIRSRFDAWLNRSQYLTFADMLFLVEQRLKKDGAWRRLLQSRFSHVIIDESQDTSYQAMRILVTVSLEPGLNTVYDYEVTE